MLLAVVTVVFLLMVRSFLLTILLAAVFSCLISPIYSRLVRVFRGRRSLASLTTVVILTLIVMIPLLSILGIVAAEALKVSTAVRPWIEQQIAEPSRIANWLQGLPFADQLTPYREQILTKAGQLVGSTGRFFFDSLSATTRGTVTFFFHFFLMLYAMFYFLTDGNRILAKILYYIPLPHEDEMRLVDRFVSVTKATLKGTLVIGVLQGSLAGAALAVAGVQGAVFWGTLMTLLSIIPGIGTALVWIPAAVYLFLTDRLIAAVLLVVFCGGIVGSIDNVLRPRLVGRDTKMHDLLILFSTLGGIALFGVLGFILGPIVAALFVTVWDLYGIAFKDALPKVGSLDS